MKVIKTWFYSHLFPLDTLSFGGSEFPTCIFSFPSEELVLIFLAVYSLITQIHNFCLDEKVIISP